ncbi:alpha/beta-hydrolase [Obba rivulosa]|uniref:Alpha/beta-hydrolase n=1 Tax=Obba rivulosa TaxID=1052685 RepID=A0A8E2AZT2_9APHY|nr:alpha/beta-hydrolase [Obba rivulosa]
MQPAVYCTRSILYRNTVGSSKSDTPQHCGWRPVINDSLSSPAHLSLAHRISGLPLHHHILPQPYPIEKEQPFKLEVSGADLDLLRKRLDLATFPDELNDVDWDYGVPLADMKRLVARWKDEYNWRKAEAEINAFPQSTRHIDIDGFGAFISITKGPGHFMEAQKIILLLTAASPDQSSFHAVALSLPGFGFAEVPQKTGFAITQYAEVSNKLILALGYQEYAVQGGDWGYIIARSMAYTYGAIHMKAWHSNFAPALSPSYWSNDLLFLVEFIGQLTPAERTRFQRTTQLFETNLADSPVGLLAWIYEKFTQWADEYPWEDDEVLSWASIYWLSRASPAASLRIYCEAKNEDKCDRTDWGWSRIPLGHSFFSKEDFPVPRAWVQAVENVVHESRHERGGNFVAYERPEDIVDDLRKMFANGWLASCVVNKTAVLRESPPPTSRCICI